MRRTCRQLGQVNRQPIKGLTAAAILFFKRRNGFLWSKGLDLKLTASGEIDRPGKLACIESPVAAQFEMDADLQQLEENRMRVKTLHDIFPFRPWVGIEQIMPRDRHAMEVQQAPKIDQICADKQHIRFCRLSVLDSFVQTNRGFVDAEHQMIGIMRCQVPGAPTHTAT